MSGEFLQFIGLCETLGALGLVLPGAFRIQEQLTALAASGLVVIMVGATAITAAAGLMTALPPFAIGILSAVVACGRWPSAVRTIQPRRRRDREICVDPCAWYAPQI
jgi:ammonia channel protein AmtB